MNGQNGLPGATPTNIYEAIKSVSKRTNAGNGKVDRPLEASEKYFAPSI
ncbi:MAG: hypothetical protein MJ233_03455 [Mycoplasmoidaceae bacterium]|nr:hypothetical protein [Mycoplasmoidaceae bacterium]